MQNGGAPHKPILLLSIIHLFENGILTNNQIYVLPELVASFKSNWPTLVTTNHSPTFALPFYHMNSEPFWNLIANAGCKKWMESKNATRSFGSLATAVKYALIDNELSNLLLVPKNREPLKITLLNKYFSNTKSNFDTNAGNDLPSDTILHNSSDNYKRKRVDENTFQEEIFIRGGRCKREIPKIYNHTCAISGLRISAVANVSMIDTCHIVAYSNGYDDSLTNGIALCPNLHRAFDRGLISISDDYTILLNKNFIENQKSVFNISQFAGKQILLPSKELYPCLENIAIHRKRFGF
jgi:putative restriction endonuclease